VAKKVQIHLLETTIGKAVERLAFVAASAVLSDVLAHVDPKASVSAFSLYFVVKTGRDFLNPRIPNWPT
jgi:hypothetical protein